MRTAVHGRAPTCREAGKSKRQDKQITRGGFVCLSGRPLVLRRPAIAGCLPFGGSAPRAYDRGPWTGASAPSVGPLDMRDAKEETPRIRRPDRSMSRPFCDAFPQRLGASALLVLAYPAAYCCGRVT